MSCGESRVPSVSRRCFLPPSALAGGAMRRGPATPPWADVGITESYSSALVCPSRGRRRPEA